MAKRYRIVTDAYAGYEVQAWRWWWPFWMQVGTNTHSSIEKAEAWAMGDAKRPVKYIEFTQ